MFIDRRKGGEFYDCKFSSRNARNLRLVFDGASLQQLLVSSVIICVIGFKLIVVS